MRILVISPNYAPEKTGSGKYTADLAEWLVARGHEVHAFVGPPHYPEWVVHAGYRGDRHSTEMRHGVHVHRVPMYVPPPAGITSKRRIRMEFSFSFHLLRPALRAALGRRFDVVIAVCPPLQTGVVPRMLRLLRGTPWVFHIQDLQVDAAFRLGLLEPGKAERALLGLERQMLRAASLVTTITEPMRQRVVAKGVPVESTALVPNWADLSLVRPTIHDNPFRAALGASAGEVVLLYAGNVGKKQGLEMLLDAAARLRDEPTYRFVIVGSGAALPELQARAQALALTNTSFLPLQPRERLSDMLGAADIHLVIQRVEAADLVMPSKLTNILAAGRPAIGTATAGSALHDVLENHGTGRCVPYGDLDALVGAIRELARDAAARETMGAKARAYAERFLDQDTILRDFEAKLSSLASENRA